MSRPRSIDRQLVVDTYKSLGKVTLTADTLSINEKSVRNILKEMNVSTTPRNQRNRKYKIDDYFFSQIDSGNKAYVLGFIWGDGSIIKGYSNIQLRLEIATKDEEILEKIKKAMSSDHRIYRRTRTRKGTKTYSSTLAIGRESIVDDLMRLGLIKNKNESLSVPNIDERFLSHFIRGLHDSDGHIGIDSKNRVCWSIISTTNLCESIKDILEKFNIHARVRKVRYKNLSTVSITKKSEAIKLRDYLYKDSEIHLNRKREVFGQIRYLKKEVVG